MAIFAVLLLALGLRLNGIAFGLPAINDPDELMFELGGLHMLRSGSLNPGWFGHPATTTMYVLAVIDVAVFAVGHAVGWFPSIKVFGAAVFSDPTWLMLPGRVAMALFGVATAWLTARLARDLSGRQAALPAALLLAVSPVAVHWAQIIRSDVMATAFLLLVLLATLRFAREGRRRDFLAAAVWLGVAVATKWPFALGGLAMVAVLADKAWAGMLTPARALRACVAFALLATAALVATSPYLVLANDVVRRNLAGEAQIHHLGATGGNPLQNAIWYLGGPLANGLGAVGLVLSLAGLPVLYKNRQARVVMLPVLAAFFVLFCCQRLVWERWALPLLPLLAISAAAALVRLAIMLARRWALPSGGMAAGVAALLAAMLVNTGLGEARARNNDTRQRAAAWAIAHVPPGSTVMIEHFGFDLYAQPWRLLFPLGDVGCVDAKAMLAGKVEYGAIDRGRGERANVDYGTMAPERRGTCRSDFAVLSQYDRYAAERADFPQEYAAYMALLEQGEVIASFFPRDRESSGPIIRIVRFRRNTEE